VIVTEKESSGLMNDLLNKVSQKNLAFSYTNVTFEYVEPSSNELSLQGMHTRMLKLLSTLRTK